MTARRLVAVFAHPDDEVLAAGLLRMCAKSGVMIHVISASRGEAGSLREPERFTGRSVAEVRSGELAEACQVMGAEPPIFLDLPDGAIPMAAVALPSLRAVLAALRPHVIVTFGPDGVYGHGDHLACTDLVAAAVAQCGGLADTRVVHTAFVPGVFASIWQALRGVPGVRIDPAIDASSLGVPDDDVQLVVDDASLSVSAGGALRALRRAVAACHRSQLSGDDPATFFRPGLLDRLGDERYVVASGPPLESIDVRPIRDHARALVALFGTRTVGS